MNKQNKKIKKELKVINKNKSSVSSLFSPIIENWADISKLKDTDSALNIDFVRVSNDIQASITYVKKESFRGTYRKFRDGILHLTNLWIFMSATLIGK